MFNSTIGLSSHSARHIFKLSFVLITLLKYPESESEIEVQHSKFYEFQSLQYMIYCFILVFNNNLLGTKPISWCISVTKTLKTLACSTGFCNPTLDLATKIPFSYQLEFVISVNYSEIASERFGPIYIL